MAVSATYEYDSTEHYRALQTVTRFTRVRWLVWLFGLGVPALMIALNVLPHWGEASTGALITGALPWVILAAFWIAFLPLLHRRAAKKLPERDASVRGVQERTVDATGYHSRGNGVSLDVPWHAMSRGVETAEFFLFFYNKQCAYYLPKRTLAPAQVEEVRTLMRAGLGGRAEVGPR